MTCDLVAFPSEFKAGLDLLPLNFKLGLGEKRSQGICDYSTARKHELLYDYQRAEDKGVNVSVIIASMTPVRLRWASSASASPNAYSVAQ
jgi:hypothetical protein